MSETPFDDKVEDCPPRLQEIIHEFRDSTPRERLDLLLEYAMDLPDLPDDLLALRDSMEQVHECQTPVFLHTAIVDDHVKFSLDIPRESPTVRGYASILVTGFAEASPQAVLRTPEEIYLMLGLQEAISPQRLRGLHALLIYMKRQVVVEQSRLTEQG